MKKSEFLVMISTYAPDIKHYLLSHWPDKDLAEDLAHDCLLQAADLYDRHQYKEDKSLKSWLFCIAYSRLIDHIRRHEMHRRQLHSHQACVREALGWADESPMPMDDPPERSGFKAAYVRQLLRTRFARLPVSDAQRRVLQLRYGERLTYKQIAEKLGEPISTVISRHAYAMRLLRGTFAVVHRQRHEKMRKFS